MRTRTRVIGSVVSVLMVAGLAVAGGGSPAGADERPGRTPRIGAGLVHLEGEQEVPVAADLDGSGTFAYIAFPHTLCYVLTARNIEPATMAHIHQGPRGTNGPIAINLNTPTSGFSAGCIGSQPDGTPAPDPAAVLTQTELDGIRTAPEGFYANVHNDTFPAGAIRGQLR
jgi:CHRD domain